MESCCSAPLTVNAFATVDNNPSNLVSGLDAIMYYIPHRPPFMLVDTLVNCQATTATAQFTVPAFGQMVWAGLFTEPGLLEHQAQVAALQAGYMARQGQEPPKMGYVAGFRNAVIDHLPRCGDRLTTTLQTLNQLGSLTALRAETYTNGILIATSEFTVVLETA